MKSVRIRSYSGPYFPAFGLDMKRHSVSLRIQSECGKIRTRITPNTNTFYAVLHFLCKNLTSETNSFDPLTSFSSFCILPVQFCFSIETRVLLKYCKWCWVIILMFCKYFTLVITCNSMFAFGSLCSILYMSLRISSKALSFKVEVWFEIILTIFLSFVKSCK